MSPYVCVCMSCRLVGFGAYICKVGQQAGGVVLAVCPAGCCNQPPSLLHPTRLLSSVASCSMCVSASKYAGCKCSISCVAEDCCSVIRCIDTHTHTHTIATPSLPHWRRQCVWSLASPVCVVLHYHPWLPVHLSAVGRSLVVWLATVSWRLRPATCRPHCLPMHRFMYMFKLLGGGCGKGHPPCAAIPACCVGWVHASASCCRVLYMCHRQAHSPHGGTFCPGCILAVLHRFAWFAYA